MLEVGRVCVKTAGREAGRYCVIVKKVDENFVLVTGPKALTKVRRRKCNITHLEPILEKVSIKAEASDLDIITAYEKASLFSKLNIKKVSKADMKELETKKKDKAEKKKERADKEAKERAEKEAREKAEKEKEDREKAKKEAEKKEKAEKEAKKKAEKEKKAEKKEKPKEEKKEAKK
jgi:large subunit ribosomal protein L14e